ncbi:MAG TPA: DNA polymerase III subunit delta' [Candidatus Hydrogenedentes bacterium]|nr:DNA polymerase III subunit delta' [Candidatus Hydrogenedentota bacterium]HQH69251.1 DNA polymerase III subunit delta' [Candidatus Hydrogenedentota bacterium]HQM50896.1 DNA polymerase III subunit delta' [Candidatus Hydrogenedentota bacterium]
MSFSDIRDQEVAVRLLRQILRRGRIPNAMLFWGPGGVGKALTALEMAKAVQCKQRGDDACGECLQCRKVASGNHPDVRVVTPKDKTRLIKKEAIEEINEICSLRPYESEWRIVIFHDAERMNAPAQNHFLKMLEEPPGRTLFILVSELPRELLPTIRSRCQMVRFRSLRPETVLALLQRERELPPDKAESIAALSQGRMDRAFDLLDSDKRELVLHIVAQLKGGADPVELSEEFAKRLEAQRKEVEAVIDAELKISAGETFGIEDKEAMKEERLALTQAAFQRGILDYLFLLETWYRDEMVYAATKKEGSIFNRDHLDGVRDRLSTVPENKIEAVEKARYYLDRFVNEERVFRDLFFALAAD